MDSSLSTECRETLSRVQWRGLLIGAAALLACVAGAFLSPSGPGQFFRAYLVAYFFYLGLALGSLAVLMLYHLTGGAWGFLLRRTLEAAMRTLPLLAVLFIPLAFGLTELYDWARPEMVSASKSLQQKAVYLNVRFVIFRAALFFILWIGMAFLLSRWSWAQDRTGDPRFAAKMIKLSGPGLVVFGISMTFAAVDWIMSLQPAFRSTIFGPLIVSGQVLTAFACAVATSAWLRRRSPLEGMISIEALNDVGNLLFTFLVIWAYMTFFQLMLIWIADLPYDVIWYLPRIAGNWRWVAWGLFMFHFVLPFFLLLSREVKRSPPALAAVAGLILFMHLVYINYQILPAFPNTTIGEHWMDVLAPIGLGGLWLANFAWDLKQGPILPLHDANQEAAMHLRELDLEQAARAAEVQQG